MKHLIYGIISFFVLSTAFCQSKNFLRNKRRVHECLLTQWIRPYFLNFSIELYCSIVNIFCVNQILLSKLVLKSKLKHTKE